jgi:ribosomal RNA-processing protein 1
VHSATSSRAACVRVDGPGLMNHGSGPNAFQTPNPLSTDHSLGFPLHLSPPLRRPPMAADASAQATAIARRLASCKAGTRELSLRYLLTDFLPTSGDRLSATDLLKLWKGIFFCFWHADKPLYQSSVATRLASAVSAAPSPAAGAAFLSAYLTTLRREWTHIDIHRLDKFYLLNRRFLNHSFLLLSANSFAPDLTSQITSVLSEKALLPEADNVITGSSRGLGYHVAEAFLDELLPVLPVSLQTMDVLLAQFFTVLEKSSDRIMVSKVKNGVFDRFLESGKQLLQSLKNGEEVEKGSAEEKLGKIGLLFGFSKKFLDIGAKTETVQANRKVVFGLRDAFVAIEKGLQLSAIEIPVSEFVVAEVPVVATVDADMDLGEAKVQKKKKKAKKAALVEGEEEGKDSKHEKKIKKDKKEKKEKKKKKKVKGEDVMEQSTDAPAEFNGKTEKKRKRSESAEKSSEASDGDDGSDGIVAEDGEKNGKKVRFSIKNNLVWKPHNPLPPEFEGATIWHSKRKRAQKGC